jgi:site-specific DNA-methyltransferase (adenine-specific)
MLTGHTKLLGHITMNPLRKRNEQHPSERAVSVQDVKETLHAVRIADCLDVLRCVPDGSVQLIVCDPPYNIKIAEWDQCPDYIAWASGWLTESERVLASTGSLAIFGGQQYQRELVQGTHSTSSRT